MRCIILSAGARPSIFEAPDAIVERLAEYADDFLENVHHHESGYWQGITDAPGLEYKRLSYTVPDFVSWLNEKRAAQYHPVREAPLNREERQIILETGERQRYLPLEAQQYPWIDFSTF